MTLTLELTPELEERLRAEAGKRDVTPETYALVLLEGILAAMDPGESGLHSYLMTPPEEWVREFKKFADGFHQHQLSTLPSDAFRRENLYEDLGP